MITINGKIRDNKGSEEDKYRFITNSDKEIYPDIFLHSTTYEDYDPENMLDNDEVFQILNFSKTKYYFGDFIMNSSSPDLDLIKTREMSKISFIYYKTLINDDEYIVFQKLTKSKYMDKIKHLFIFEGNITYKETENLIMLNNEPDAVYDVSNDRILFKNITKLKDFCPGIDELYKVATEKETAEFVNQDFIELTDGYKSEDVGIQNRKRISAVKDIWNEFEEYQKKEILEYTALYCSKELYRDGKFHIRNEKELKDMLYGISQRYYTTYVGKEKRIAKSIAKIGE